jgi:hypothetical protein
MDHPIICLASLLFFKLFFKSATVTFFNKKLIISILGA